MLLPDLAFCVALVGLIPQSAPTRSQTRSDDSPAREIHLDQWLLLRGGDAEFATSVNWLAEILLEPGNPPQAGQLVHDDDPTLRWEPHRGTVFPTDVLCAYTRVNSPQGQVRMAQLSGAGKLFVNGACFLGDRERRGYRGVPIALQEGVNELYVGEINGRFELELWTPPARVFVADWGVQWPRVTQERISWINKKVGYMVLNASTSKIESLHHHYGHAAALDGSDPPSADEWQDGARLGPLGIKRVQSYFLDIFEQDPAPTTRATEALVPVMVWAHGDGGDPPPDTGQTLLRGPLLDSHANAPGRAGQQRARTHLGKGLLTQFPGHAPSRIVYGTQLEASGSPTDLDLARSLQQRIWYETGKTPTLESDVDFMNSWGHRMVWWKAVHEPDSALSYRLDMPNHWILLGTAESNAAWKVIVSPDQRVQINEDHWSVDGVRHTGRGLTGWFRVRKEGALVITYSGASGARLGDFVDVLGAVEDQVDFAIFDQASARTGEPATSGVHR